MGSHLSVVSCGKELSVCGEHDEACWARDRRASLEPDGKAKGIARIVRMDERAERRESEGPS